MGNKQNNTLAAIALIVALLAALGAGIAFNAARVETEEPVARSYGCAVYTEQGCAKFVVATGGEIEVQAGGIFDLQAGATANLNAGVSTTGTLTANALVITATSSLGGNISSATGVVTITDGLQVTGTGDFNGAVDIAGNLTSATGAITVADTLNATGAVDFDSTLNVDGSFNYGTQSLYPLGYASDAQQIECGVTSTFTDTVAVTASALTTATYVTAIQVTDPVSTAALLTVDTPAANVFNIDSWEADYTVGTTGVTVYWCAVGNQ